MDGRIRSNVVFVELQLVVEWFRAKDESLIAGINGFSSLNQLLQVQYTSMTIVLPSRFLMKICIGSWRLKWPLKEVKSTLKRKYYKDAT